MFVKSELSREQSLKRRKKSLSGKTNKQKFITQTRNVIADLEKITQFHHTIDDSLIKTMNETIKEHEEGTITSSKDKVLDYLLECHDDVGSLLEDMKYGLEMATYERRLSNILNFLRDFQNTRFTPYDSPYADESSPLVQKIQKVAKRLHYKTAKLSHSLEDKTNEIHHFEKQNIDLASKIKNVSKNTYEYTDIANKMSDNHSKIEMLKGNVNTLRKTKNSFEFLAKMFDQLSINEEYHGYLKDEGHIKRLIKRIYKDPSTIDMMEDTLDLTEVLNEAQKEIDEVEAVIKPARKMAVDVEDDVDEDIIAKYKNMAE